MALAPGTRISTYEIVGTLGEGGMGRVYRAHDTKLGRDVALKILPEIFAADPDRLARFEREARTLAALNHANIAHVYDAGRAPAAAGQSDVVYLAMELVPGDDLAQRLQRGALPLAEALPIARQIAEALEAAHEQGIIHRDLKPANVKVRDDGTVKVLDFGLAKALDAHSTGGPANLMNSPTLTARATQMGLILGTAAYMSPEQARGRAVDRRADIWSFGVVLAELLTGDRLFKGDDATEVIAKVIERDPDLTALPSGTPAGIRSLIARCLTKDPKQRLRDIGEARIAIEEAIREVGVGASASRPHATSVSQPGAASTAAPSPRGGGVVARLGWIVAALLTVALVATVLRPRPKPAGSAGVPVMRTQISMPQGVELYSALGSALSVAPDGLSIAFVGVRNGVRQAFVRRLDSYEITPIKNTEATVACTFSPDSKQLLVGAVDTSLRRVRISDGYSETVTPASGDFYGAWLDDGRIVYSTNNRLAVATSVTQSDFLTTIDEGSTEVHSQPVSVPGTNAVVFVSYKPEQAGESRIEAVSLDTRKRHLVVDRASSPAMTASGHLLFVRDDQVLAAPFDAGTLTLAGDAMPVLRDVKIVHNRGTSALLGVSNTGTLVYADAAGTETELLSVSRDGHEQTLLRSARVAANPRLTPDGRQLMFEEIGGGLFVLDVGRGTLARLTDGRMLAAFPILARDGRTAVFRSPTNLLTQPLDGSAPATVLKGTGPNEYPNGFTPDGSELIYTRIEAKTAGDLRVLTMATGTSRVLLSTNAYEGGARLSPDGKLLVYVSSEEGNAEVYLQPYPAMNRRYRVSASGGLHPVWNPKGGEIFYRNGEKMMSVRVSMKGDEVTLSPPVALFSGRYAYGGGLTIPNYTVTADGDHFIVVREQTGAHLNVITNWLGELKR